jgi:DNA-binding protein HU-beta
MTFSKIVIKNQAFFHIFYCHRLGFYAIKGKLQLQVERVIGDNSLPRRPEVKINLKGGWASGYPFFRKPGASFKTS